jgi:hypothetical protein
MVVIPQDFHAHASVSMAPETTQSEKVTEGVRSKFSANDFRASNVVSPKIGPDPDYFNRQLEFFGVERLRRDLARVAG